MLKALGHIGAMAASGISSHSHGPVGPFKGRRQALEGNSGMNVQSVEANAIGTDWGASTDNQLLVNVLAYVHTAWTAEASELRWLRNAAVFCRGNYDILRWEGRTGWFMALLV